MSLFVRYCFCFVTSLFGLYTLAKPLPVKKQVKDSKGYSIHTSVASVSLTLTHMSGATMPVRAVQEKSLDPANDRNVELVTYATTETYPSGTQFKVAVLTDKPTYLYVINADDLNRTTRLFPAKQPTNGSPIVAARSTLHLPGDNRSFTLPQQPGDAYVLVLVANRELDIDALVAKFRMTSGDFKRKVYTLLGSDLIAPTYIRYDATQAALAVVGTPKGSIVPLLVAVGHR